MQHQFRCPDSYLGGLLSEVTRVPIRSILVAGSPRTGGEDPRHINALAEVCSDLPPIVVHRKSMTVIDGVHRLRAVQRSGATHISAVLFNGDEREAFVLAVKLNSSHGLPLTLADRKAAALQMLADFPEWSNRRLAGIVGLSDKTVAALRRRSAAELPHPATVRVGRDGVAYPLMAGEARRRAMMYLAEHPDASAREVARAAGISLTTAKDARRRVRAGQQEATSAAARGGEAKPAGDAAGRGAVARGGGAGVPAAAVRRSRVQPVCPDLQLAIRRLRADPSLRFTEVGRRLLRTLDASATQPHDWAAMAGSLPIHCAPVIAELARHQAVSWQLLAESLTERLHSREADA
ncbi:ParB/RepB/Spo0J family partition protein [Streptomyces thermospinosisporus]|uniref:ParB/RepB/Spo0J family partition protein n=1 Tax=Streptomyces thermospinosisporus TaxID=161482 RepID=UPI0031DAAD5A